MIDSEYSAGIIFKNKYWNSNKKFRNDKIRSYHLKSR